MTTQRSGRHRLVARLGVLGGGLGTVAGVVQLWVGPLIPEWTGDKADPVPLGLLTVALSLLAVAAARLQRSAHLGVGARAVVALALLTPGLLCLTTVGRLWLLPGALLVAAAVLTIDDWPGTGRAIVRGYPRYLLAALGAAELLMAAGARPLLMAAGVAGGLVVVATALLPRLSRPRRVGLVLLGTMPFAALAAVAVVPLLLPVLAVGLVMLPSSAWGSEGPTERDGVPLQSTGPGRRLEP